VTRLPNSACTGCGFAVVGCGACEGSGEYALHMLWPIAAAPLQSGVKHLEIR
jgi:hypothetical protein